MIKSSYYNLKPLIPRKLQIYIRRKLAKHKRKNCHHVWPIDASTAESPKNWTGWPDNKKFAFVLSHDVDTQKGHDRSLDLLMKEKELGLRSTFNIVPERYTVSKKVITEIKAQGFEVNVHGLKHDGKLFRTRKIFDDRAVKINRYLREWGSNGFTAPSMICNHAWVHDLNIKHSTCTFDTDPFEPIPNPSGTIFPFSVTNPDTGNCFVELPYTLPQDHGLFIILQEKDNFIWKQKLDWIVSKGGMALINTHPDYMDFQNSQNQLEEYPVQLYLEFLQYVKERYRGQFWHALPSEVSSFWRRTRHPIDSFQKNIKNGATPKDSCDSELNRIA